MHNHSMNVILRQARIGDGKSVLPVEHQRAHLYGSLMAFLSLNAPILTIRGMAGEEQESHQASGKLEGSTTHSILQRLRRDTGQPGESSERYRYSLLFVPYNSFT